MSYKHSKKFYDSRYATYRKRVKAIGGTLLTKNEFKSAYEAISSESKNVMKDLVYGSKYGTKYNTAVAERRALRSAGIKATLEDLKTMTTQDFADMYAIQLANAYSELRRNGTSGKDAALLISQQWFGSK